MTGIFDDGSVFVKSDRAPATPHLVVVKL